MKWSFLSKFSEIGLMLLTVIAIVYMLLQLYPMFDKTYAGMVAYWIILQNAEVCGKTPGQEREPKLLRLTGPLNNSKGSL